jgi:hypothetical protein
MSEQISFVNEQISYLVLHTRLAMLRNSLATVCNAIKELERVRRPACPGPSEESLVRQLSRAVSDAENRLRVIVETITDRDRQREAAEILNTLSRERMEAAGAAEVPRRQLFALGNTSVGVDLSGYANDLLNDLDEIEVKIDAAAGQPEEEAGLLMADAWSGYRKALANCHELFVEYIDLVRGVLIRDAGLDQDLCRIADSLIKTWHFAGTAWSSLSIPAEDERPGMSTAQLIRLGFPEWSIWSLPLVAREFGHVFTRKRDRIDTDVLQAAANNVGGKAELRSWAADIFATTVAGSAYPWAAIVLRADPDADLDQARVAVMLYTMELMNAPVSYYEPLALAWQGAVASPFVLSEEQKAFVSRVKSRIGVDFKRWERANLLVDRLIDNDEPEEIASALAVKDLRTVLVAAWQARIRMAQEFVAKSAPGEPADRRRARWKRYAEKLRQVAEQARAVCIAIIDGLEPGTGVLPDTGRPPIVSSLASRPDLVPRKSPTDYGGGS